MRTVKRTDNLYELLDILRPIGQAAAEKYTEGDDGRIRIDARDADVYYLYADDQLIESIGVI